MTLLQTSFVITVYGIAVAYEVVCEDWNEPLDHLEHASLWYELEGVGYGVLCSEVGMGCHLFLPRLYSGSAEGSSCSCPSFDDGQHFHYQRIHHCHHVSYIYINK